MSTPSSRCTELQERYALGRWSAKLLADARALVEEAPCGHHLALSIDITHNLQGMTPADLDWAQSQLHRCPAPDFELECRLIALHELTHNNIAAESLLRELLSRFAGRTGRLRSTPLPPWFLTRDATTRRSRLSLSQALLRHPRVLALAHRHAIDLPGQSLHRAQQSAIKLLQHERSLSEEVLAWHRGQDPVSIAVVGNAPSALHHSEGERIDACHGVIRFNQAVLTAAVQPHVGQRTRLWVMSPSTDTQYQPNGTEAIAVPGANPLYRPGRYWRSLAALKETRLIRFDPALWYELVAELEAPPTAGLLCLRSLHALGQQVHVLRYGFGAADDDVNGANHYGDRGSASSRHNWPAERALVQRWWPD